MKLRRAVLSAAVVLSSACASTGETTSYSSAAQDYPDTRLSNDELYMARVEAAARRRGIDLTWVNPPKKIVAKQD